MEEIGIEESSSEPVKNIYKLSYASILLFDINFNFQ